MTGRDELIEQAAGVLGGRFSRGRGRQHWYALAERVVDAGWRPPVEGDVIERAAQLIDETVGEGAWQPSAVAQALADAGLLAGGARMSVQYVYVPIEVLTIPQGSGHHDVLVDRWWLHIPGKGAVFALVGKRRDVAPQCNPNRAVQEHMASKYGQSGTEAVFIARAFVPIDHNGEHHVPHDRGVRS